MKLLVKIKKLHKDAVLPKYARTGDAGLDLTAVSYSFDFENNIVTYHTGIALEIPSRYVGLVFPRSSSYKYPMIQSNCVGVIDSGYRGEILVKQRMLLTDYDNIPEIGDRIAQLILFPYPQVEFVEADKLTETERGDRGYGSTGC